MILFLITYWGAQWLDELFPVVDLSNLNGSLESIAVYVRFAGYFLPMPTVTILFAITSSILAMVVYYNIIRAIWQLLPIL